jgi:hypothetical protein
MVKVLLATDNAPMTCYKSPLDMISIPKDMYNGKDIHGKSKHHPRHDTSPPLHDKVSLDMVNVPQKL